MSSPHPLNQAVIAQALHDLRNGQLRRCQAMGFSPHALEALKQPPLASLLANAKVAWCSVKVNGDVLNRLLDQGRSVEQEIAAIDRMLRLGASTEMVSEFHGLTHQEVALRRQVLGLPQRKGRWPVLTEAEDARLWERWHAEAAKRRARLKDDAAMLAIAMDLASEQSLNLSVVWGAIRRWINEGLI
jgi:hypothetical protein